MAMITANTLVKRGAAVLVDGTRFGILGGNGMAAYEPTTLVSMRHLHSCCLFTEPRADQSAPQAGRPGSYAGVLNRRSPASLAGRSIPCGWSLNAIVLVPKPLAKGYPFQRLQGRTNQPAFSRCSANSTWAVHAN